MSVGVSTWINGRLLVYLVHTRVHRRQKRQMPRPYSIFYHTEIHSRLFWGGRCRKGLETGFHCVTTLAVLEQAMKTRLILKSQRSSCLCLTSAGIQEVPRAFFQLLSYPHLKEAQNPRTMLTLASDSGLRVTS